MLKRTTTAGTTVTMDGPNDQGNSKIRFDHPGVFAPEQQTATVDATGAFFADAEIGMGPNVLRAVADLIDATYPPNPPMQTETFYVPEDVRELEVVRVAGRGIRITLNPMNGE